ncbi:uncharacterized protein SCHCODRAFT_02089584 [Schizophyllum commune H4-8]|uniref:uncharacterized protein n=1 Tax=Schizophyllum commune (strain H4-8 / FGSC 9210) TaxID=578458 RepID=UPI002160A069|nr:uncharacterized protein SCHCODRAFT_02089584 [Schizophyllum commune H4-8]KAI5887151.1 hypothetical protein SCHCODRAFT_02089584 [Schizophyllum commune H4-8]
MTLSLARWYESELPSAGSLSHRLSPCLRSNATPMVPTQLSLTIPAGLRGKLGGELELLPYNGCLRRRLTPLTIALSPHFPEDYVAIIFLSSYPHPQALFLVQWRSTKLNFPRTSLLSYHSMNLSFPLEFQLFIFPIHPKPFSELPSSPSPPSLTPPVHKACPPKPLWQFASSLTCPSHVRAAHTGGIRFEKPSCGPAMSLILRVFALVISRTLVTVQQLLAHRVISRVPERARPRFPSSIRRSASPDIARYRNPSCQCQASPALAHCFMIYVTKRATRTPVPSASSCHGAALCSARSARDRIHLPMIGSPCRHSKSIYPQRFVVQGPEERTRLAIPSQDMHPSVF